MSEACNRFPIARVLIAGVQRGTTRVSRLADWARRDNLQGYLLVRESQFPLNGGMIRDGA